MTKKTKRLYVEQGTAWADDSRSYSTIYRVKRVINSTEIEVKQELTKEQLDDYCEKADWQVTIS